MAIVVSCAGDTSLATRLLEHLARFSFEVKVDTDEIIVSGISLDQMRHTLEDFLSANSDLSRHTLTEFEDIFTIGIMRSIDDLLIRCETCGYIAHHEDEMMIRKRIHALVKLL
ncbi:MAG TPA: hypothetical protein VGQ03_03570 [Nitrososphaera sp.]|nr:hypothetical protein [Nitrososphaera sp.]